MATVKANGEYQYPLVPRKYWPAVQFACKMIRENGYRNKAIRIAANYYGVDEDELSKHVAARSAAGKRPKGYKMKWFVVATNITCEADFEPSWSFSYYNGKNKDTIWQRVAAVNSDFNRSNDTGSCWSPRKSSNIVGEFTTKEEALKVIERFKKMDDQAVSDYFEKRRA